MTKLLNRFTADPRHFQILTLSLLLGLQIWHHDFGPSGAIVCLTLASSLVTQTLCGFFVRIKADMRSPLITGLSLSILLKAGALWIYPMAAVAAIGSKFVVRVHNKHVFNPANFGIVAVLLLCPGASWVSPGQWGGSIWFGFMLVCLALLVLYKIPKRDMGPLFLIIWSALLFGRALWLNDPMAIPIHQLQNGALLIFAFFMISDPKTIPKHFVGRFLFALAAAVIAFILQFQYQIREGLFYALVLACAGHIILHILYNNKRGKVV